MTLADLRACLAAMPAGTLVPADWVRAQLEVVTDSVEGEGEADFTAGQLAKRWNRGCSTVRTMCERGELVGAYKFRGREWRIPRAAVLAYEAAERAKGEPLEAVPVVPLKRRVTRSPVDLRALARGRAS